MDGDRECESEEKLSYESGGEETSPPFGISNIPQMKLDVVDHAGRARFNISENNPPMEVNMTVISVAACVRALVH